MIKEGARRGQTAFEIGEILTMGKYPTFFEGDVPTADREMRAQHVLANIRTSFDQGAASPVEPTLETG